MRIYEELFIAKPDALDEEVDAFIEQIKTTVSNAGGTVDKVEKWGKRKLAYKVDRYREGAFVLFQFSANPETVKEFERRLRVSDLVIKFLTVRIDETLKRLDKRKKERDKRAHRKSIAAPSAPQPSVAQQMMGEGSAAPAMPGLPNQAPKEASKEVPTSGPKEA
jgi:small subunit ribosomal protein S6